jgi:hypothetical protein
VPAAALVVVVLIVGAALIWWLTDGQRRFGAAGDGPTRSEPSFVADGEGREEAVQRTVQPGELEGQTGTEPVAPAGESEARLEEEAGEGPVTNDAAPLLRPSGEMLISGPGGPYRVMVSSHKHEAAAALEADELAGVGVEAEVAPAEIEGRGIWYRVLVSGGYPSLTRARTVLDTIKSFGYEGAWIERAPR